MARLDFVEADLAEWRAAGRHRDPRPIGGPQDRVLSVHGHPALNFSSNNYLGLANHAAVVAAASAALSELGVGAGASRLVAGNLRPHRELEALLADHHGCEAALLFNSGYSANVGVIQALLGPEDVVFSDSLNHASIVDGCRLSRARIVVYPHADPGALAELVARDLSAQGGARRRLIVTDSIFSMDGDLAPLRDLAEIARQADALLMVDEAHATGVTGPLGRGLCAELGVRADIHVGTLSKGLGAFGAYVLGTRGLVEWLVHCARSFVFTTALPPSICSAAAAAVRLSSGAEGAALRTRLAHNIEHFRTGLGRLGLLAPRVGRSPIFPVLAGADARAMEASEALLRAGIFAQGIRPPTVPRGTARLRFALMATHTEADLDQALGALATLVERGILPVARSSCP